MSKTESDTSKKILEAALRLVESDGYANVSMRGVAGEAGVAISQISYHYKNKDGLFAALIKEVRRSIVEDFRSGLGEVRDAEALADFLCAYARESITGSIGLHRLRIELSNLAMNSEPLRDEFSGAMDELAALLAARLEGCEPRPKLLATQSAETVANFIIAAAFGISTQYLIRGKEEKTLAAIELIREIMR